ncbi:hypothetical protein RJ639_040253 [Escallonia herrerae]|uniref:Uncharacterized protein n=1 Tax=Escallonia herrerae TaxID=1293975 RepID=A0AA89B3V1_9ASTE|nr:hypothetical protein RJ639_040253 [Escallonia herrerae]
MKNLVKPSLKLKDEQLKALTAAAIGIDEGYREAYQGQILKIYSAYEPVTGQRLDSTITQSQYQFTRPPNPLSESTLEKDVGFSNDVLCIA